MHLPPQAALNKAKQELEAKRAALKEQNKVSAAHHTDVETCAYWGEPERAPHVRVVQRVRLFIYIYIYIYIYRTF